VANLYPRTGVWSHTRLLLLMAAVIAGCEYMPGYVKPEHDYGRISPLESREEKDTVTRVPGKEQPSEPGAEGPEELGFYRPGTETFVRDVPRELVSETRTGNVTLNFENTSLREAVKVILSDVLQKNYVMDPAVQGSVTLQTSTPIAREDLFATLELLLRMNNAALVHSGQTYEVVPRERAVQSMVVPQLGDTSAAIPTGFTVRIVPLRYIAAEEMQNILEPFANVSNVVRVDTKRNLIILAGDSQELTTLLDTVRVFDVDWMAGMSVALFTPDFVNAKTLTGELEQVFENIEDESAPGTKIVRFIPIERLNAVLVITPLREVLREVATWIDRLDQDVGVGRRLFVYRVQNGRATEIADVLNQVFLSDETAIPPAEIAPGLEPVEISAEQTPPGADLPLEVPAEATLPPGGPPIGTLESGFSISEGSTIRVIPDDINNTLLILATPQEFKQVKAAMEQLDVVPLQVLIEATIAEISLTDDLEYGVQWTFRNNNIGDSNQSGVGLFTLGSQAALNAVVPGFSYSIVGSDSAINATLNALARDSKLNIISSPSLMVLNNQEANIQVGDEVPITTQQQQATTGVSTVVNSIEYRDTGVLLTVTPRVNSGGLIIMDIVQEVSNVAQQDTAAAAAATLLTPTIQTRRIASSVAVQSGDTIVLGGLIRENKSEIKEGIPGLYKLPLIGWLFGATRIDRTRTELVVLITPRAVQDADTSQKITDEFVFKMRSLEPLTRAAPPRPTESDTEPAQERLEGYEPNPDVSPTEIDAPTY